jgi:hypothetical protein
MDDVFLLTSVINRTAEGAGGSCGAVMDGDHRAFFIQGDEQVISANLICIKSCSTEEEERTQRLCRC